MRFFSTGATDASAAGADVRTGTESVVEAWAATLTVAGAVDVLLIVDALECVGSSETAETDDADVVWALGLLFAPDAGDVADVTVAVAVAVAVRKVVGTATAVRDIAAGAAFDATLPFIVEADATFADNTLSRDKAAVVGIFITAALPPLAICEATSATATCALAPFARIGALPDGVAGRRTLLSSAKRAAASRVFTKPVAYTANTAAEPSATRLFVVCLLCLMERGAPGMRDESGRNESVDGERTAAGWEHPYRQHACLPWSYGTGLGFVASSLVRRYRNSCPS